MELEDEDPFGKKRAPFTEAISEVEAEERTRQKHVHHQRFAENLSVELSWKEFQRMKADEGEEA